METFKTELVDVDGSLARLVRRLPGEAREAMRQVIKVTAFAVKQRMAASAPVGPDAPHIREAIEIQQRGLMARVGYLSNQPAFAGRQLPTQAAVALFNEYSPNKQPFMRPSAKAESSDYTRRAVDALNGIERTLAVNRYQ